MPHTAATATDTPNEFVTLGLASQITEILEAQGFNKPTPIQAAAIPELLAGNDIMASAQTGTGKTAAFLLPALHKLTKESTHHARGPRILVLTPTRELAEQVSKVATEFCRKIPRCKVVTVVGGVPYPVQNKMLAQPYEVLVATPGRLTDLLRSGRIDFRRLELLVLDEADRMLDMGFIDEVEAIVDQLPKERQTALFSATLTESVQRFAGPMLRSPKLVEMAPQATMQAQIAQSVHYADGYEHKQKLVAALLKKNEGQQSIIFTATKISADEVAEWLKMEGFKAAAMHGDLAQRDRRRTLDRLRRSDIDMIVATDVAARGIDVAGISLVVNFDLPRFSEDYIHRIGRTGRAGRTGEAVSLVTKSDFTLLTKIRRQYNIDFTTQEIEGLEARFQPGRGGQGGGDRGRPGNGGGRGRGGYAGNGGGGAGRGGYAGNRDGGAPRSGGYQGNRDGGSYADRAPRGDRPEGHRSEASRGSFGERSHHNESRGGYGERAPRDSGYQGAPRERSFGSGQSRDHAGDRTGGYNRDAAPRGNFGGNRDGAPRSGGYGGQREGASRDGNRGGFGGNRDGGAPRGDRGGDRGSYGGKPAGGNRGGGRFS
ncbi:DEAD/DEAH box helicase [Chitinibacter sp. GC72]|uniref:DEAD/DEAH box helicase n=1 Tax=Chitinibacter sp. GC72 TaxID=1526917 RepID=UPI0012F902B7|nr:DEAD/DEAH box helicase [Chitinibacter sp. GC72]